MGPELDSKALSKCMKLDVEEEGEPRAWRGEGNQHNYLTSYLLDWRKGGLQALKVENSSPGRRGSENL